MGRTRLEAFSDAVIAIIMTIMVLELKVPHETTWAALRAIWPVALSYLLSFIYLGIYWNNHHHMLHTVSRVNGAILWANLHLLFWLSLVPFSTAWVGENQLATVPTFIYGVSLLLPAIAYYILQRSIVASQGPDGMLARMIGVDIKGKLSPVLYAISLPLAFWQPWVSMGIYVLVALIWLVPDDRIERGMQSEGS